MNQRKKITIQQNTIESLTLENNRLKSEIENLKQELDLEKSLPNGGYAHTKKLMDSLENKIAEYDYLIKEVSALKSKYAQTTKEIAQTKKNYNTLMTHLIKTIRKK